jgi:aspartate kinase
MPGNVVGVASERDTLLLEYASGERGALLETLDAHRVAGKQVHQAGDHLTLVISRENLHEEPRVRQALASRFGDAAHLRDDLGAVSVVGAGINASFQNLRRGVVALDAAGIGHHALATSSFRITWMVPRPRLDDAVRALHDAFIAPQPARLP